LVVHLFALVFGTFKRLISLVVVWDLFGEIIVLFHRSIQLFVFTSLSIVCILLVLSNLRDLSFVLLFLTTRNVVFISLEF
jgi:hypothetical protein